MGGKVDQDFGVFSSFSPAFMNAGKDHIPVIYETYLTFR